MFKVGADKVVINSEFYNTPALLTEISKNYGRKVVVVSLDVLLKDGNMWRLL
ncbi:MAG: imidazole glycerol phosphate synthase subunit HisF, partial [Bermanella sp.]